VQLEKFWHVWGIAATCQPNDMNNLHSQKQNKATMTCLILSHHVTLSEWLQRSVGHSTRVQLPAQSMLSQTLESRYGDHKPPPQLPDWGGDHKTLESETPRSPHHSIRGGQTNTRTTRIQTMMSALFTSSAEASGAWYIIIGCSPRAASSLLRASSVIWLHMASMFLQ